MAETNEEAVVTPEENEGGAEESNVVKLSRDEYDKILKDLGSTKRELKDLKKPKEEAKEAPQSSKPDDSSLQRIERLAIKQAGITHADDVDLARKIAKETGKDIEDVLESRYFKVELEAQQTARANVEATSGVKGNAATSSSKAKESVDYWLGQDRPPTPTDIPDKKLRQSIIQKMVVSKRNNKTLKFYND